MKQTFLAPARVDLRETIRFYEDRRPGLGAEFAAEVKATITRVLGNPAAWPRASENTHRCRLQRFPYALIYQILPDRVRIVAVAHIRRHPDSWKGRLDS
jgi:plasmid stabilization system protein ParE